MDLRQASMCLLVKHALEAYFEEYPGLIAEQWRLNDERALIMTLAEQGGCSEWRAQANEYNRTLAVFYERLARPAIASE